MLGVGNRSETFVQQTVGGTDRLGWRAYVLGLNRAGPFDAVAPERIHTTEPAPVLRRIVDRVTRRAPEARFTARAQRSARAWEIALIHAHFGWSAPYAAALARATGVPLLVTFYGSDASAPPPMRYRHVLEQSQRVIAVSEYVTDRLRALGFTGPIELIRNGVDLSRLTPRTSAPTLAQGRRLLFVGRLVEVKGADVLMRAMPAVLAKHPDTRLELIGEGPERQPLGRLARQLGIERAIRFRGGVDHHQVLEAMARAHAVVVPSRVMPGGQAEASSMAFKEALALGVPAIATASGGLTEACPPALRQELAAPGDPTALAGAIMSLLDDPDRWPHRATLGRLWLAEHYDANVAAGRIAECYAGAVAPA
jgi:glycosyltransferase involved in cell wall biosynthesis